MLDAREVVETMLDAREALVTRRERLVVGYDRALALVKSCEAAILRDRPDMLVGVLRGGAIPALMLSQRIDVPVIFCAGNRGDAQATLLQASDLTGQRVLVIDDIAATGATLARAKAAVERLGGTCRTMALFYDPRVQKRPDYGHLARHFIHFVWEKLEVTPASRHLFRTHGSRYAPAAVTEYYGFDLQGMLLGPHVANADAAAAQVRRKGAKAAVFVTAQRISTADTQRLRGWGLDAVKRVQATSGHPVEDPAAFKVRQIQELGISTWFEGDIAQALQIARDCPVTDVVFWNTDGPLRLSVAEAADV